jgi:hypothetical protein
MWLFVAVVSAVVQLYTAVAAHGLPGQVVATDRCAARLDQDGWPLSFMGFVVFGDGAFLRGQMIQVEPQEKGNTAGLRGACRRL